MKDMKYNRFISIVSQEEVVGEMAVEATELLINLDKEDLKEEDFDLIESFITVTQTTMTSEESNHIVGILDYIRTKR